jgi:hypothetical protein
VLFDDEDKAFRWIITRLTYRHEKAFPCEWRIGKKVKISESRVMFEDGKKNNPADVYRWVLNEKISLGEFVTELNESWVYLEWPDYNYLKKTEITIDYEPQVSECDFDDSENESEDSDCESEDSDSESEEYGYDSAKCEDFDYFTKHEKMVSEEFDSVKNDFVDLVEYEKAYFEIEYSNASNRFVSDYKISDNNFRLVIKTTTQYVKKDVDISIIIDEDVGKALEFCGKYLNMAKFKSRKLSNKKHNELLDKYEEELREMYSEYLIE